MHALSDAMSNYATSIIQTVSRLEAREQATRRIRCPCARAHTRTHTHTHTHTHTGCVREREDVDMYAVVETHAHSMFYQSARNNTVAVAS